MNILQKNKILSTIVLLIAISMMAGSAMISYFVIRKSEPQIMLLKADVQNKQALIRDVWNNIAKKESRADLALLLSVIPAKSEAEIKNMRRNYLKEFLGLKEQATADEIIKAVKQESVQNGEYIDSLYLEQLNSENKIAEIESNNKWYSDIAFFLQTLSLILIILRRDLPEHN